MSASKIYLKEQGCGTIACHAGFYEFEFCLRNTSRIIFPDFTKKDVDFPFLRRTNDENNEAAVLWHEGAKRLARDLEFTSKKELESWAEAHPTLWGNRNGESMFKNGMAFGSDTDIVSLQRIVTHWRNVANRIEKLSSSK